MANTGQQTGFSCREAALCRAAGLPGPTKCPGFAGAHPTSLPLPGSNSNTLPSLVQVAKDNSHEPLMSWRVSLWPEHPLVPGFGEQCWSWSQCEDVFRSISGKAARAEHLLSSLAVAAFLRHPLFI